MKKKIISVILLSVFLICNIGSVFGESAEISEEMLEIKSEIAENKNEVKEDIVLETDNEEESDEEVVFEKKDNETESEEGNDDADEIYFNVTFKNYDKKIIEIKKVKSGEKVEPLEIKNLEKDESVLWYTEEEGIFDFNTPITKDLILIAEIYAIAPPLIHHWVVDINFHTNGGSPVEDISLIETTYIDYLPTTKKAGYKF